MTSTKPKKMTNAEALALLAEKTIANAEAYKALNKALSELEVKTVLPTLRFNVQGTLSQEQQVKLETGTHLLLTKNMEIDLPLGQEHAGKVCLVSGLGSTRLRTADAQGNIVLNLALIDDTTLSFDVVLLESSSTQAVNVARKLVANRAYVAKEATLEVDVTNYSTTTYDINQPKLYGKNTEDEAAERYLLKGKDRLTVTRMLTGEILSDTETLMAEDGGNYGDSIQVPDSGYYKFDVVTKEGLTLQKIVFVGDKNAYVAKEATLEVDVENGSFRSFINSIKLHGKNDEDQETERYLVLGKDRLTVTQVATGKTLSGVETLMGSYESSSSGSIDVYESGYYKFEVVTKEGLTVEKTVLVVVGEQQ